MRPGDLLRQVDRQLLPPLARGMARLGHGRLRLLTSVALLCSAAVLVTAVWAADRRPVVDQTVGEVTRVGVSQGQSIPGYVESSRGELRALLAAGPAEPARQTYALVTMTAYLAPDRLTPVLTGVSVSEVFSRLRRPGTQTQIVRIPAFRIPEDVVAGMLQVADLKDQEVLDYQERSASVTGDGAQERDLRRWYDSGARVADEEATAYRSQCSCVYAAVVRAEPVVLDRLASRPEVRAVDPAPEVRRLDRTVFTPPLPEQVDVVRPPPDASMPADSGESAGHPVEPAGPGAPGDEPVGPTTTAPSAASADHPDSGPPTAPSTGPGTGTTAPDLSGSPPSGDDPAVDPSSGGDPPRDPPSTDSPPVEAPSGHPLTGPSGTMSTGSSGAGW